MIIISADRTFQMTVSHLMYVALYSCEHIYDVYLLTYLLTLHYTF